MLGYIAVDNPLQAGACMHICGARLNLIRCDQVSWVPKIYLPIKVSEIGAKSIPERKPPLFVSIRLPHHTPIDSFSIDIFLPVYTAQTRHYQQLCPLHLVPTNNIQSE